MSLSLATKQKLAALAEQCHIADVWNHTTGFAASMEICFHNFDQAEARELALELKYFNNQGDADIQITEQELDQWTGETLILKNGTHIQFLKVSVLKKSGYPDGQIS